MPSPMLCIMHLHVVLQGLGPLSAFRGVLLLRDDLHVHACPECVLVCVADRCGNVCLHRNRIGHHGHRNSQPAVAWFFVALVYLGGPRLYCAHIHLSGRAERRGSDLYAVMNMRPARSLFSAAPQIWGPGRRADTCTCACASKQWRLDNASKHPLEILPDVDLLILDIDTQRPNRQPTHRLHKV